eukprot:TRINITY_DN10226_c0_g1_i1.p1 TRINITY_DN10226_c0_g1~~TRINITY_DN10226_c0_g1_i1.p1  ORF type:complete len:443 (+),score=66.77 TRINITY_DN10226_c0_g1_i1:117-1445(+)
MPLGPSGFCTQCMDFACNGDHSTAPRHNPAPMDAFPQQNQNRQPNPYQQPRSSRPSVVASPRQFSCPTPEPSYKPVSNINLGWPDHPPTPGVQQQRYGYFAEPSDNQPPPQTRAEAPRATVPHAPPTHTRLSERRLQTVQHDATLQQEHQRMSQAQADVVAHDARPVQQQPPKQSHAAPDAALFMEQVRRELAADMEERLARAAEAYAKQNMPPAREDTPAPAVEQPPMVLHAKEGPPLSARAPVQALTPSDEPRRQGEPVVAPPRAGLVGLLDHRAQHGDERQQELRRIPEHAVASNVQKAPGMYMWPWERPPSPFDKQEVRRHPLPLHRDRARGQQMTFPVAKPPQGRRSSQLEPAEQRMQQPELIGVHHHPGGAARHQVRLSSSERRGAYGRRYCSKYADVARRDQVQCRNFGDDQMFTVPTPRRPFVPSARTDFLQWN